MRLRPALPLITGLLLSSRVASPDAGPQRESLPFLGPIPEDGSKPPTQAEWAAALDLEGSPPSASECTLRRVREWIRFRCVADKLIGPELLAGTASEIAYSNLADACPAGAPADGNYFEQVMVCNARIEIVFPLRRGDRRLFQVLRQGFNGYNPFTGGNYATVEVRSVLSVAWVADEPGPEVATTQYGP